MKPNYTVHDLNRLKKDEQQPQQPLDIIINITLTVEIKKVKGSQDWLVCSTSCNAIYSSRKGFPKAKVMVMKLGGLDNQLLTWP